MKPARAIVIVGLSVLCFLACDETVGPQEGEKDVLDAQTDEGAAADSLSGALDVEEVSNPEPLSLFLTINAIPEAMNGSVPYQAEGDTTSSPYHYLVPEMGFELDVIPHGRKRFDLAPEKLTLSCDVPVGRGAQALVAGTDISYVCESTHGGSGFSCRIPEALRFSVGDVTCTAHVEDVHGQAVDVMYAMEVGIMTPQYHPFAVPDVWLILFSRDNWTVGLPEANGKGAFDLPHTQTPNGIADYVEDLTAVGLISDREPESSFVRALLEARMRVLLHEMYVLDAENVEDRVNLELYFEGDAGAPGSTDTGVSVMGVGGFDPRDALEPVNGRARIDWNNQESENNNTIGLGIFTTAIFWRALAIPIGADALSSLLPGVGQPIGYHPKDSVIWTDAFDRSKSTDAEANARFDQVMQTIDFGGLALASVLAHEMGHSLGLVPEGLPPEGLFSNVGKATFMATEASSAHIDVPGLNIMQEGNALELVEVLFGGVPFFAEANLAYLRGRIIVPVPVP